MSSRTLQATELGLQWQLTVEFHLILPFQSILAAVWEPGRKTGHKHMPVMWEILVRWWCFGGPTELDNHLGLPVFSGQLFESIGIFTAGHKISGEICAAHR